ncbi:hypothetical protein IQ07DRAFT_587878 [Pyrenochaeta sp. DS3sAY3a]|nr:hypothetical protein IQ07DRAFT_587878 [Pyrenochaeta sp. DS3sAY3a]
MLLLSGSTNDYCRSGCQSGFGTCSGGSNPSSIVVSRSTRPTSTRSAIPSSSHAPVSNNGRCGALYGGQTCQGSSYGNCCSQYNYVRTLCIRRYTAHCFQCGKTNAHCTTSTSSSRSSTVRPSATSSSIPRPSTTRSSTVRVSSTSSRARLRPRLPSQSPRMLVAVLGSEVRPAKVVDGETAAASIST